MSQGLGQSCRHRLGLRLLPDLRSLAGARGEPWSRRQSLASLRCLRQWLAGRRAALSRVWRRRWRKARLAGLGAHAGRASCRRVRRMPALHQDHHHRRSDTAARRRAARHAHACPRHGRARARLRSARAGLPRRAAGGREDVATARSARVAFVTNAPACNAGAWRRHLNGMRNLIAAIAGLAVTALAVPAMAYVVEVTTSIDLKDVADKAQLHRAVQSAVDDVLRNAITFSPTVVQVQNARVVGDRMYI